MPLSLGKVTNEDFQRDPASQKTQGIDRGEGKETQKRVEQNLRCPLVAISPVAVVFFVIFSLNLLL